MSESKRPSPASRTQTIVAGVLVGLGMLGALLFFLANTPGPGLGGAGGW